MPYREHVWTLGDVLDIKAGVLYLYTWCLPLAYSVLSSSM